MEKKTSSPRPHAPPVPVIPLPIALYESKGLIFELYQGGQPSQAVAIRWERLKAVTVTRDNRDFNVEINQRGPDLLPER